MFAKINIFFKKKKAKYKRNVKKCNNWSFNHPLCFLRRLHLLIFEMLLNMSIKEPGEVKGPK